VVSPPVVRRTLTRRWFIGSSVVVV
jgi:hypothetical protein